VLVATTSHRKLCISCRLTLSSWFESSASKSKSLGLLLPGAGGAPVGGFVAGAPVGGFVAGPVGGFVAGAPVGGFVAGAPVGGFVAGPVGGFVAGAPVGGFVAGASVGGFVAGAPVGGFVAGAAVGEAAAGQSFQPFFTTLRSAAHVMSAVGAKPTAGPVLPEYV
jgi:hypothetical protein